MNRQTNGITVTEGNRGGENMFGSKKLQKKSEKVSVTGQMHARDGKQYDI